MTQIIELQYEFLQSNGEECTRTEVYGPKNYPDLTGPEIRNRAFERYNQLKREGCSVSVVTDT